MTADYGWLSGFYPARRITEECEKRSIELRFLFPRDVPEFLSNHGRNRPSRVQTDTVCLIRGQVGTDTVRLLETAGITCVNSSSARIAADDKLKTARFLESHGWPTPATRPVTDADIARITAETPDAFAEEMLFPYPFVLKPRFGSRGNGVTLIERAKDLAAWKSRCEGDWIAQEFIATSRGRDLRAFFAGGDLLACVERHGAEGEFRSNASTGGIMTAPAFGAELSEPWNRMVLEIARESGLWYGTVDFLYRTEPPAETRIPDLTICEINSAPGFEALETHCGIDIAGPIVERLVRDFSSCS
jgi:ribosomal protein S6--L-glutamate ligase